MDPEKLKEKWEEVCFHLSEDIKPDIKEDFFEQKVLMVLEKLGWHQYKGEIKKKPSLQIGKHTRIEPDLVLYGRMNKPEIVVEVKRPSIELNKNDIMQLISYMRQLKSNYGLLIWKEIHVYYDGNLNPKQ